MGWFTRKKPAEDSAAARLDGIELLCVARRYMDADGNQQEEGLGKGGRIDTANGHVIITCGDREVFVNDDITSVTCGELMSLGGAIFTGYNTVTAREDTVITYYKSRFRQ